MKIIHLIKKLISQYKFEKESKKRFKSVILMMDFKMK
jgi:hypothetical protein